MNRERFIRISSWALILGAITLMIGDIAVFWRGPVIRSYFRFPTTLRESAMSLAVLGPLLLAIGMLGLLYRYGDEVGRLGKGALAIGAISGFVVASGASYTIGLFNEVLGDPWIMLYEEPGGRISFGLSGYWTLHLGGLGVLYLSLVVFGVTALIRKPLPRWNWLPILAGIVPLMIAADSALTWSQGYNRFFPPVGGEERAVALGVSISAVVLVLLGYVLQTDTHRDSAIA